MRSEAPRATTGNNVARKLPQNNRRPVRKVLVVRQSGGARRDRTDDLLLAKQALSQLSYGPVRYQKSGISSQGYFLTPDYRCLLKVGGPGKI